MRVKHGMSGTKEYKTWRKIKEKCYKPNCLQYPKYGGKGITFEYKDDFLGFLEEVGYCPSQGSDWSIERIDPNKGYVKGNIKWIETKNQAYNKTMLKTNTSGVTGVYSDGTGWRAEWWRDGKKYRKYFKLFEDAVAHREAMIAILVEEGFPYSEHHGK